MKTELFYLMLTAVLTGLLWIPVVIGYVKTRGPLNEQLYRSPPEDRLPDWVRRCNRAHLNAVENFAPFAAVVIVAQLVNVSTPTTVVCAEVYFFARLAHAIVHMSGFGKFPARTLLFTIGWIAFITYAVVVLMKA